MTTVASNLYGQTYEQQANQLISVGQQSAINAQEYLDTGRAVHAHQQREWYRRYGGGLGGLGDLSSLESAKTLAEQMQMDMDSYLKDWDKGDCDE